MTNKIAKLNDDYLQASKAVDAAWQERRKSPTTENENKYEEAYKRLNDLRDKVRIAFWNGTETD